MSNIADSIIQYNNELDKLTRKQQQLSSDVEMCPYVTKIYCYMENNDKLKNLIKKYDIDNLLIYHCNSDYSSPDNVISNDIIDALVDLIRGSNLHLVALLKSYKKLLINPKEYYQELYQSKSELVADQIKNLKRNHLRNLETCRQMLEVQSKVYKPYDFSFIIDNYNREMIQDHWNAMVELNLTNMFTYPYRGLFGMSQTGLNKFSDHPNVQKYEHSGGSLSWIFQKLHQLVRDPWNETVNGYLSKYMSVIEQLRSHTGSEQEFLDLLTKH